MKKKTSYLAALLLLTLTASCSQQANINTSKTPTSNPITNPGTTGTTQAITCPRTTPGAGLSCNGDGSDGDGCAYPITTFNIKLAGNKPWSQMEYSYINDPLAIENANSFNTTQLTSSSDGRLRVRVKLMNQPEPVISETIVSGNPPVTQTVIKPNCYGRVSGPDNNANIAQGGGAHRYEELSYVIRFYYSQYNNNGTSTVADDKWEKSGNYFFEKTIEKQKVSTCSDIIDINTFKLQGAGTQVINGNTVAKPILIEISNIRTDMFCKTQAPNDPFCNLRSARSQECYSMKLQVVTDSTDDFK